FANGDNPLKLWDWGGYTIFADCPIETAHLGRNYESGRAPFRGRTELRQATVSDNVRAIQKGEFRGCTKLLSVTLGNNIAEIGDEAFYNCDTLQTITLPSSVTSIGNDAFAYCKWLKSANLSENLKLINGNAFYDCNHLAEITIPASVDSIGAWAFRYAGLKKAFFADGANPLKLWDWGGYTIFANCPIESAHLGRNYESGRDIFRDIRTIKRVSIGSMVSELHASEFRACDSIANIYSYCIVPPTCLANTVFASTNKQTCQLHIPKGTAEAYMSAFVWREFFNIIEMPAGDVNGDGIVDVADIATILSVMAGNVGNTNLSAADVNCDQKVDVADISTVLSIMSGR
ncbi:MAG: leucine-rich repeat protein, partial [Prevotella sp.]|nr:leucine-rich repeat protein [Prevotella sp.]